MPYGFNVGDQVRFINPPRDALIGLVFLVVKDRDTHLALEGEYPDGVPIVVSVLPSEIDKVRKSKQKEVQTAPPKPQSTQRWTMREIE